MYSKTTFLIYLTDCPYLVFVYSTAEKPEEPKLETKNREEEQHRKEEERRRRGQDARERKQRELEMLEGKASQVVSSIDNVCPFGSQLDLAAGEYLIYSMDSEGTESSSQQSNLVIKNYFGGCLSYVLKIYQFSSFSQSQR